MLRHWAMPGFTPTKILRLHNGYRAQPNEAGTQNNCAALCARLGAAFVGVLRSLQDRFSGTRPPGDN